jgi:hypothetical protein
MLFKQELHSLLSCVQWYAQTQRWQVSWKVQVIRYYESVFGSNLYDTDVINSILEIRLALYCPVFEDMKSSFFTVADFLSLRAVTLLIFR